MLCVLKQKTEIKEEEEKIKIAEKENKDQEPRKYSGRGNNVKILVVERKLYYIRLQNV